MIQVSCQCALFVVVTVVLISRPTFELYVDENSHKLQYRLYSEKESNLHEEVKVAEEYSIYRPNERDKPSSFREDSTDRSTNRRRKRSSGILGNQRSEPFVFPDQISTSSLKDEKAPFVVPNTAGPPPCARGDTFCESVDEYPSEHVIRLLRKEPVFVRGFFQDERKQNSLSDDINVQDRIDASDENPLCPAQEHIVYPKMAKNIDGNWLFVINQDEYIQGVRVEKCLTDRECSFPGDLPIGYKSQCKQKYIYRKLVALNGTGQGVISDSFQFPSCCSCIIKLDHNLAHNRFAGGGGPLPLTLPKTTPTPSSLRKKN